MAIPAPRTGAAALVTGASSGIGAEIARQLASMGYDLILVARRRERLEELAAELRALGRRVEVVAADVSERSGREHLLEAVTDLGLEVDVFICSAGFGMGGAFIDLDPERIELMVRTNVEATFALTRALAPPMAARRSGAIMLVSSVGGEQPMPNFQAYAATKAAVTSFAESLHWELGRDGVTVTALSPGGVRTEFAGVAGMEHQEERAPMQIDPPECARAGLRGMEAGHRVVIPHLGVRAGARIGRFVPRRLLLPAVARALKPRSDSTERE